MYHIAKWANKKYVLSLDNFCQSQHILQNSHQNDRNPQLLKAIVLNVLTCQKKHIRLTILILYEHVLVLYFQKML